MEFEVLDLGPLTRVCYSGGCYLADVFMTLFEDNGVLNTEILGQVKR